MRRMKPEHMTGRAPIKALLPPKALPRPPRSGTVYTPRELATAVVATLHPAPGMTWLEPCIGDGALLQAINEAGVGPHQVTGLDLARTARKTDHFCHRSLRGVDFLAWAQKTRSRFDRIVANPPYVALSKVPRRLLDTALLVKDLDGQPVRQSANYWFAFLCASIKLLKPGGSLAFILPAAWDYADYAESLRERLIYFFAKVEVRRCRKPMFKHVSDGCVLLIAREFGTVGKQLVREEYDSLQHLIKNLPASNPQQPIPITSGGKRLGDVIDLRLGGVTGDAGYFLLTEEQRQERGLPKEAFTRVLSRASHIETGHVTQSHWKRLEAAGERVWLFRPEGDILNDPAVKEYLRHGKNGGCNTKAFKIKSRKPWHHTPIPASVHGFMTGMSRHGIWCCLNEMSDLNATNTLYVVTFKNASSPNERAAWSMALLTSIVKRSLDALGRRYPDGLRKFEPGDLLELRIPEPPRIQHAHERYLTAITKLIAGEEEEARRIADSWFTDDESTHLPRLTG